MGGSDFVHLHNHTMYSLLDGAIKIPEMLKMASEMGMNALAITDHGNLFGAIEFYTQAKKRRIKPIIGIETYIVPHNLHEKRSIPGVPETGYHLVLLTKNNTGYKNLIKLSTIGFLEGFYHKPRIDKEVLAKHSEGLIALSGCLKGEVAKVAGDDELAEKVIRGYLDIFGSQDFFLEIQDHGIPEEASVRASLKRFARKFNLDLVATNDCHYLKREHYAAHDALLCIQTVRLVSETDRLRYNTDQLYLKSSEQMKELFADTPEAIENSLKIAERCNLEIEMDKKLMPGFPLPEGYNSANDYLDYLSKKGLEQRYRKVTSGFQQRLDYELKIIKQMGYSGYFLIVKDFIDYAKNNNIPVGPGRGSAAGSLVSYCLGITNIDPINYGLLFERFLNPERISMPDIDIDFSDRGRDRVIEYVTKKYGQQNVAQIITFGSMAARAVVRDVGRVLSIPYGEMDKVAKMIPEEVGVTLERALSLSSDLKQKIEEDEKIATVIEYSKILEGLARHASKHAAGVVIAPSPLTDYLPLYKTNKDEITTQYDMRCIEDIGLLKVDFLGLRTLTVIDDTIAEVARTRGIKIDLDKIPLDDPEVYKLFSGARTVGVFQFESGGMRDYLRRLGPTCIEDLIAMNALYRPGPLDSGMIDTYIECKKGKREIKYEHPLLEPILKDTYGVIVFQEQVLKIAQEMAGYTLGKADILRKAMGKKQAEVMAEQKVKFIEGAVKRKVDEKIAEKVFDQIETFGRYGFVKAHSTGYAVIAYQTAYLKTYYPQELLGAALTSEMGNTNKVNVFKKECKDLNIELVPPDVNEGYAHFSVSDGKILFGLAAVKNVGLSAVESIVKARREEGKFSDIFDFCSRVDLRLVNKKALESLVASGAFDSIHTKRAQLYENVETILNYGIKAQKEALSGQSSLFDQDGSSILMKPKLKDVPPWSNTDTRNMEKEVLGFYLSSHPLEDNYIEYISFADTKLEELENLPDGKRVMVGGIIQNFKINTSRNNKLFAIVEIEDLDDTAEVIVFSDCLDKKRKLIKNGNKVLVSGIISTREGEKPKIKANDINLLETAYKTIPCDLHLYVNEAYLDDDKITFIGQLFDKNPGKSGVLFHFQDNGTELISRSKKFKVKASPALLSELALKFGENNIKLSARTGYSKGAR